MTEDVNPTHLMYPYLPMLRALIDTYTQIMSVGDRHIEQLGLTPAQFDVLATLGDTPGMTCKELGENTLITKGTLTGVLDRLENKGFIERTRGATDHRQIHVKLTEAGDQVFNATFYRQLDYLSGFFGHFPPERQAALTEHLQALKAAFLEHQVSV